MVTDGDVKPSVQIHTQALTLIFLILPPTNLATQLIQCDIQAFIVSQLCLLSNLKYELQNMKFIKVMNSFSAKVERKVMQRDLI